jgi:flagellar biosynthesis protein FlhA
MKILQQVLKHTDLMMGAGLLVVVSMLILPLPHWALDFGLVIAVASSIVILLTAVNVTSPLQFNTFPSILLLTTLFRVALSIAATKLILGSGEGGHVIETFGEFVLGGNFIVGFISFVILMIVQFIVITQGSTRISEVTARFTLDAMPGKQMAIDADLGAGLINEQQARERREAIKKEADFYGAMDGASKFVKGDAIASILILIINIIGGFAIGASRGEGDALTILQTYAMLSVGEGLVSQIPALLISTAAGLLVTRNGQETGMGGALVGQIMRQPRVLASAGIALCAFGFIPGFPTLIFLGVGGALIAASRLGGRPEFSGKPAAAEAEEAAPAPVGPPSTPEEILSSVAVEPLEIEIGYGLTALVDKRIGGDLPERVSATRRQLALEMGCVMPSVRIRDHAMLGAHEYVIKVKGEEVARGEADPGRILAIDGGGVIPPIAGDPGIEPVFGLPAVWIDPKLREMAERSGYTCVEPSAMMGTHLAEVAKTHAAELLTRQETNKLLEQAKLENEAIVAELVPDIAPLGDVQKVLQHLLRERISIRDLATIFEAMADFGPRIKDPEQLGELTRASLSRTITRQHVDEKNILHCIALDGGLIQTLQDSLQQTAGGVQLALPASISRQLVDDLKDAIQAGQAMGHEPVLIAPTQIRLGLRKLVEPHLPQLPVLAYNEISANAEIEFLGTVSLAAAAAA